jgi:hypothetical protein
MYIENKTELLMLLIGLESASEAIQQDERMTEYYERSYVMLYNKIADEYNELVHDQEEHMIAMLAG